MKHFELVEADLARYYGVDLPAAVWGDDPIGARRLGVLVRGLPPESATVREINPAAGWGNVEELLATLVELTHNRWLWFHDVHARKGTRRPPTLRLPRPGQPPPPAPLTTGDDRSSHHGRTSRPPAEVVAYLRRFAPPKQEEEVTGDG